MLSQKIKKGTQIFFYFLSCLTLSLDKVKKVFGLKSKSEHNIFFYTRLIICRVVLCICRWLS